MRKEISSLFKFKTNKTKRNIFLGLLFIVIFIIVNGLFVYLFDFSNYYFFVVKKIIPYPAFMVGNKIVTFSYYDDRLSENKKIYEVAYRINFDLSSEGKKNFNILKSNIKDSVINRTIMEKLLEGEKMEVTSGDINKEYDNMLKGIGSDKEISNILKYSSSIRVSDIKDLIYQNILKERIKNNFIYNLKMKAIVIKPVDAGKEEDWNKAAQQSQDIYNDIASNGGFDKYWALYGDKGDTIVQNFGREYYFGEDLPKELQEKFYSFGVGKVNGPVKSNNGYYIFNVYEKKGYYKGSYDDFMKEQKNKVKIISFLR
jgi:hypothetical protein